MVPCKTRRVSGAEPTAIVLLRCQNVCESVSATCLPEHKLLSAAATDALVRDRTASNSVSLDSTGAQQPVQCDFATCAYLVARAVVSRRCRCHWWSSPQQSRCLEHQSSRRMWPWHQTALLLPQQCPDRQMPQHTRICRQSVSVSQLWLDVPLHKGVLSMLHLLDKHRRCMKHWLFVAEGATRLLVRCVKACLHGVVYTSSPI